MPVELEIRDGDPWWMSPDIWTVPGENPEGAPGPPVVGQSTYLWAEVRNGGTSSVSNAVVRFYWANPAAGFDRTTAHLIGTSNVNLLSGESAEVLCLTPWYPEYVNQGHECVLAEAFHPSLDNLPATPDFNVPTDRHVAQRNINVVQAVRGFFAFPFMLYNTSRIGRRFRVRARQGRIRELEALRKRLGIELPKSEGELVRTAFVEERCPAPETLDRGDGYEAEMPIPGKGGRPTTLIGTIQGPAALVHVEQYRDDQLIGGISVLVRG